MRLVLDTSCQPVVRYLRKLTEPVACRIISCRTNAERLPRQVVTEEAHFAVRIGDDGETSQVLDERGRPVPAERLLLLIVRHLLGERPQGTIVLEKETAAAVAASLRRPDCRVVFSDARRASMERTMRRHGAKLAGGPSGRFWYTDHGPPLPDALITLTLLLVILSQSDRRLSEVLDLEAALV